MNIEFDKLRQICIHSSGKALSKCFKTASQCVEQNCPLKAEEKVCRWKHNTYERYGYWATECGNAFMFVDGDVESNNTIFCQYCGGKVVLK